MKFGLQIFKSKVKKIENEACLNCGQPFSGHEKFCSYCGQKNTNKKLTFATFINNLVSGFFSYDSRFWSTFIPLLTKPGKVSKDYIEGKRARFVNPFQLYLNISIIFFLVLGISNRIDSNNSFLSKIIANEELDSIAKINPQQLDSIITNAKNKANTNFPNDSIKNNVVTNFGDVVQLVDKEANKAYAYNIEADSVSKINFFGKINDFQHYHTKYPKLTANQALDSLGYENTFWNNFYYQEVITVNKNWEKSKSDGGKEYVNKLFSYLSISLFIFLPIFTLFLMLLYIRRKYTYMEHLVFVFNTQTVFFLLLLIFYLLNFMVNMENSAWVFMLLFIIYLYKAMRNFYNQSRLKTIVKYILLNSFYLFLAFFSFVIVAAISFVSN